VVERYEKSGGAIRKVPAFSGQDLESSFLRWHANLVERTSR